MRLAAAVDLGDDLEVALPGAAVMVDFTAPDAAFGNAQTALAAGVAPIVGTTGMSAEQVEEISRHAQRSEIGGPEMPHFSIGGGPIMRPARSPGPPLPPVWEHPHPHPRPIPAPAPPP